jgi:hypothetical protein
MDHIEFLKEQGAKGGRAGTGAKKRRGNSAYYRRLAKGKVAGNSHQRRKARRAAKRK